MPDFPAAITLWAAPEVAAFQAEALARQLGIVRAHTLPENGPLLWLTTEGLAFRLLNDPEFSGILRVDFDSTIARRRSRQTNHELLIQAAKIRQAAHPLLIDATAGLGRDGFLLATHGFRVRMIEANPVVAALLADGLARAGRLPHLAATVARIGLTWGNAADLLSTLPEPPEVIYLDPMFPERNKSAKVKQDLRLLQVLHTHAPTTTPEALLMAALAVGARKVVIKRPLKGPPLAGLAPSYSLKGKAVRFDVHVGSGKKEPLAQTASTGG